MSLTAFPGGANTVEEPDWSRLIPDPEDEEGVPVDWRDVAHREWLRLTQALHEAGTLGPENRHQVQRLVVAYIRYDLAVAKIMKVGAIVKTPKTKVPMLNLWQCEMRAADSDATTAEMELGIPPRRRGAVTKVQGRKKAAVAADSYLRGGARK